jgi:hypothetical protein
MHQQSQRFPILVAAVVLATVAAAILLSFAASPVGQLPFQMKNKDFANYWMAGHLMLEGRGSLLFGKPDDYFAAMKAVFGADYPPHNWSYPPHAVLILLPLGQLGYLQAMALFLGLTLALYLLAVQSLRPNWTPMAAILLTPFIVGNLVVTQNGFLTAALMIGGLALRDRKPVTAGILLGLLTFKPQLGLLLPILLVYERRWMVILAAVATTIMVVLASILAFGPQSWLDYISYVVPKQADIMNTFGGDFPHMIGSAFGSARSLGLDAASAMRIHLPFALAGFVLFLLSLWRLRNANARAFAMLIANMLVVPYSVAYDFGALATFAALWPLDRREPLPALPLRLSLILAAILPIGMLPLGQAGLPLTPLILLAAFLALLADEGRLPVSGTSPMLPRPSKAPQG